MIVNIGLTTFLRKIGYVRVTLLQTYFSTFVVLHQQNGNICILRRVNGKVPTNEQMEYINTFLRCKNG
jgi:hypothetical protein